MILTYFLIIVEEENPAKRAEGEHEPNSLDSEQRRLLLQDEDDLPGPDAETRELEENIKEAFEKFRAARRIEKKRAQPPGIWP